LNKNLGQTNSIIYLVGLGLVAASVILTKTGNLDPKVPFYLTLAGVAVLLGAFVLMQREFLKPMKKLHRETMRFVETCFDQSAAEDGKPIDGVISNLSLIENEISEKRLRAEELETAVNVFMVEKQQTETILRSLPIPVLITDRFDDLTLANDAAGQLFGFDSVNAKGSALSEVLRFPKLIHLINETSSSKIKLPQRTVETRFMGSGKAAEDKGTDLRVNLSTIVDPSGEILGVVTVIQDISRDKEIERMKSELVANVSHDLQTPLASIQAYMEMLIDGEAPDEETRQYYYSIIFSECSRLNTMIENLLSLSMLEAGVAELKREKVNLYKVLQSVVDDFTGPVEKKKQQLESDISPYLVPVKGDSAALAQVFSNILSNANKFSPEKGQIKLQARLDGEKIQVDVIDNGPGIAHKEQRSIFDSLHLADNGTARNRRVGLGLAIAKKIIGLHSGTIAVESEVGKGSHFKVCLPVGE